MIEKIVSGGQTGADRAGLDAARVFSIPTGGWAPQGWKTADGPDLGLAAFGLVEHEGGYKERTVQNIVDSDGTLIISKRMDTPGTKLTLESCEHLRKPYFAVPVSQYGECLFRPDEVCSWVRRHEIKILNIAGNSEHKAPGIYRAARDFLVATLEDLRK